MALTVAQLTGCDDSHITYDESGVGLAADTWVAFSQLREAASEQGFDLRIASGFRNFDRQLAIWNGKVRGERSVHDDEGEPIAVLDLSEAEKIHAILRFSALPGASRHHWGSDLDVYDAAAMPQGYQLQLVPEEVRDEGMFGPLHLWLDTVTGPESSSGFYRPYAQDRGGVAPERWHMSFEPLARECVPQLTPEVLAGALAQSELELHETLLASLPELFKRYIQE
jgi:LAS superfamily LD-carboxypeptidase LdcB